ncbi:MAG TPA: hypothetical protein VFC43_00145 [Methanoregula sp.]|nr:hypothetical protein [Methanoregula sp.]
MKKRLKLATRAFGAEPVRPDIAVLAEWIAVNRGTTADIITYLLDQSLAPQVSAGILAPCSGGRFYKNRIVASLLGVREGNATDEIGLDSRAVSEDAAHIIVHKKGAWFAMPAPHLLGITDMFYHDESEWHDAIAGTYRTIMRSMRDAGISGHVLICDALSEPEITALSHPKVFFFQPKPDRAGLSCLLEHQHEVVVSRKTLDTVLDLTNEFDIRKVIIMDPDEDSISRALSCLDPDHISAGGYCLDRCETYWKNLLETAVYTI